jgi:hypothetical protein
VLASRFSAVILAVTYSIGPITSGWTVQHTSRDPTEGLENRVGPICTPGAKMMVGRQLVDS